MEEPLAYLLVERGPLPNKRFPLSQTQVTIGRSNNNDVVLVDPEVSRRHARLLWRVDHYVVEDMGSTNGTFVNGHRVGRLTPLDEGDSLELGDTVKLRFNYAPAAAGEDIAWPAEPDVPANPASVPIEPVQLEDELPPPAPPPLYAAGQPAGEQFIDEPPAAYAPPQTGGARSGRRGCWLGCAALIALLLVCAGTFAFLDAYDQGRLLYCGSLKPFFQIALGPLGFAPVCP